MQLQVGTSGYSYKEWKGGFYPEEAADSELLSHYSAHFPTVEINNTFYRLPTKKVLAAWAEQVPANFEFVIKASRRITHLGRLKTDGDALEFLYETTSSLGDRLGPLLFQLPPNFKKNIERLSGFLDALPDQRKIAVEFRHSSWFDAEVYDLLRAKAVALCVADAEAGEEISPQVATADFGYFRLRKDDYSPAELDQWAARLKAQPFERAYVFFKHEGDSPRAALKFVQRAEAARKWEPSAPPAAEELDRRDGNRSA